MPPPKWLGSWCNARSSAAHIISQRVSLIRNPRFMCWFVISLGAPKAHPKLQTREWQMNAKQLILAGSAVRALSIGPAQAGPCDMTEKSASSHDAGWGPPPENPGQPPGTASGTSSNEHPPTGTMNRASG